MIAFPVGGKAVGIEHLKLGDDETDPAKYVALGSDRDRLGTGAYYADVFAGGVDSVSPRLRAHGGVTLVCETST